MILDKVQTTLDTLLYPDIYVFWNQFKEIQGKTQSEYVVYTQSDSPTGSSADNKPLTREAAITTRYYYDTNLEGTKANRTLVQTRAKAILTAMENAGFETTTGIMFMGDIDGIGKSTAVIDFIYVEVE